MNELMELTRRNIKLFFKDKGMFFGSLITPLILLVLFATFLARVYRDGFTSAFPDSIEIPDKIINGLVGGHLCSSLLAVSCITVSFCSNMLMVQDKVTGARRDLTISPVKSSTMSLSYFIASEISSLIIAVIAMAASFLYLGKVGWFISVADIMAILADILMLTLFGTALSSIINSFLSSQGQISAVSTIVSSAYGFICGAYMPISQCGKGLQSVISFFPGTYGTSLIRNHTMRGVYNALENETSAPDKMIEEVQKSFDYNVYFFDNLVSGTSKTVVLSVSIAVLIIAYVILDMMRHRKKG